MTHFSYMICWGLSDLAIKLTSYRHLTLIDVFSCSPFTCINEKQKETPVL